MKTIDQFIVYSIISRAGNSCADFAFIWLGISLATADLGAGGKTLSAVYIGQSVGVIILGPLLAKIFDLSNRRLFSIAIDILYGLSLISTVVLYEMDLLNSTITVFIVGVMAALGLVHRSSVTMHALKVLGENQSDTVIGSKFALLISLSHFIGAMFSGVIFKYLGFSGCLVLGGLTFLPIIWFYFYSFKNNTHTLSFKISSLSLNSYFRIYRDGFGELKKSSLLLNIVFTMAIINIAAAVMPALTSLSIESFYPDRSDIYSLIVGFGILAGIATIVPLKNFLKNVQLRLTVAPLYIILCVFLGLLIYFDNLVLAGVMFAINCIASTAINITSGTLRHSLIPHSAVGTVNTIISLFVFSGQLIGGAVLLPLATKNLDLVFALTILIFILGSIWSFLSLPKIRIRDLTL